MRTHVVALTVEDLEGFLKRDGGDINTKDYELYAAVILAKLYARQFGKKYLVAFPAKREKTREVIPDIPEVTIEFVQEVLRTCLDSRALGFSWTPNCDENESEITRRCV